MSRCVSCQAVEAAVAAGNVLSLEEELKRQAARISRGQHPDAETPAVDAVPRDEHERIVARLNRKVAALNARLEQRKAG